MVDSRIDGQFIIKKGGITQGIANELGLTKTECKKISSSIWTQIINEFNNQENMSVSNNHNDTPSANNNYLVHENAVVRFNKDSWNRIVGLVNKALNKNIEVQYDETVSESDDVKIAQNTEQSLVDTPNETVITHESKKPANITKDDINQVIQYNDIKYANQKGVLIEGQYYDFDEQGRCTRIYKDVPQKSINGTENSYTLIEYNSDNEVEHLYRYIGEGKIDEEGTRTCAIYDKNGKLAGYYIESGFNTISNDVGKRVTYNTDGSILNTEIYEYDTYGKRISCLTKDNTGECKTIYDSNGNEIQSTFYNKDGGISSIDKYEYDSDGKLAITYNPNDPVDCMVYELYSKKDYLSTEKGIKDILDRISELEINKEDDNKKADNLYFVMTKYAQCTGRYMLDDIAKINPKSADLIINAVKERETTGDKYTDDILTDMSKHPDDYKKLTIDIQRLMNRTYILENDDNVLTLNNEFDEATKQGNAGDCFLLSNLKSIDSKTVGRKALKSIRQDLSNGDVIITCKGNNRTYLITREEILSSDHLSTGDDDMRIYEIAMDKYRRDMAYEDPKAQCDNWSGTMSDVLEAFLGVKSETELNIDEIDDFYTFNDNNSIYSFSIEKQDDEKICRASEASGKNVDMVDNHEYRIVRTANNRIYFTNPWDDSSELSMTIEEFKNMQFLSINKFDLNKLNAKS